MRTAPRERKKKGAGDRKRRVKVQRKRLVALGMDEQTVRRMTSKGVRDLLKRPVKTAAHLARVKKTSQLG